MSGFEPYNGEELEICPVCGEPKWRVTRNGHSKFRVMCDCERSLEDAEETRLQQAKLEQRVAQNRKAAFSYPVLVGKTFEQSDNQYGTEQQTMCQKYARNFVKKDGLKNGLLLYGDVGSGKTYLSAAIANELLDAGYTVIMRSMPKIMAEYRLNRGTDLMQRLENCDLLIIDDLGAERDTSYGQELVYSIIDGRYSAEKPFIVSTNTKLEDMHATGNIIADRIYDRILECCFPIKCNTGRKRVQKNTYEKMKKELFSD